MSVHDFTWKRRVQMPKDEEKRILATKPVKYETIPDIDSDRYDWVMVGREKYGRVMYCQKTGIVRTKTMGEFYQGGEVD